MISTFTASGEKFKYLSLFSGVGGFELGIGERGECIGYSEIDKYSIETYQKHFKEHTNYGDATTINAKGLPDFDLLVGGFPCQAFSIAGKRKGFDEARGTLFFDIARILKHKRPSHFFLENVKGLLSHDSGKTFQVILEVLSDLGYGVEWQLLNGKRYVPQNRERIVIIGHLRDECTRKILPFRFSGSENVEQKPIAHTINSSDWRGANRNQKQTTINVIGSLNDETWSKRNESIRRVHGVDGIAPTTPTGTGGGVMTKIAIPVLTPDRAEKRQNGRRFKTDGEPAFTLNTQDIHGIYNGARIRRLTPLECERLMGWEDNWTEGVSDTQRYKQCGNGIIAPMVTEVITALCNEGCLQERGIS